MYIEDSNVLCKSQCMFYKYSKNGVMKVSSEIQLVIKSVKNYGLDLKILRSPFNTTSCWPQSLDAYRDFKLHDRPFFWDF